MDILPNNSGSKNNQTMRFCQFIKFNMINIFLEKSYTNCGRQTSPRLFFKKIKLNQQSDILYSLLLLYLKGEDCQKCIKTKTLTTCFYFIKSFLKTQNEIWSQSPRLIFCMIFEETYFLQYILLTDEISLFDCLYFLRYWAICAL